MQSLASGPRTADPGTNDVWTEGEGDAVVLDGREGDEWAQGMGIFTEMAGWWALAISPRSYGYELATG